MNRIYLSPPDMGPEERALLLDAFDSNWIAPLGPHVDAFEAEFSERVGRSCVALASGTAALHLALILLGVGPGDEVLVSDLTFAASANVVRYVGATPIFIDAARDSWTMDPELLREALRTECGGKRSPKAVIVVDLYGQCADYGAIGSVCAEYDIPIIQDACEALGATYKGAPAGTQGLFASFSFNGNKIITCSGGGMLVSERADAIALARTLASQAREPAPHYEHTRIGYNYRLSNLLAAVGRAQLAKLDEKVRARRANYEFYRHALGSLGRNIEFMPEAAYGTATRWLTCVVFESHAVREAVRLALERQNIEARPLWKPMSLQPVYSECRAYGGLVGRELFDRGLCLPSGSGLTEEDRARILEVLRATLA